MSWLAGSRLNHKVYTILEYNPAISTVAAITTAAKDKKKALGIHSSLFHAQALSFVFTPMNSGMWTISGKIQAPGMITWDSEA